MAGVQVGKRRTPVDEGWQDRRHSATFAIDERICG